MSQRGSPGVKEQNFILVLGLQFGEGNAAVPELPLPTRLLPATAAPVTWPNGVRLLIALPANLF